MATIENLYVGDGTTVLYSFTFPYIEETDVKVSLDEVDTTAYSLANATTVEFATAPANGVAIRIYRNTSVDEPKAVFYPGSAIRAQDLNDNFEQNLFVLQEATFDTSQSAADSAAALAVANSAETKADSAIATANTALTDSASALAEAAQASTDAATAQQAATEAASDASDAQIAAQQANDAVQQAGIFVPVATYLDIPASPSDLDKIKVVDSTGIENAPNIGNLPNLQYDSEVSVDLLYSAANVAWVFVEYIVVDPDTRYIQDEDNTVATNNIIDAAVTPAKLDRSYLVPTDIPAGIVQMFAGSVAPTGWLECNGQSTAGYAALAAVVGPTVPDLRGEFVRGWSNGRGVDSGRSILSTQTEDYKAHNHSSTSVSNHTHSINSAGSHTHSINSGGSHTHNYTTRGDGASTRSTALREDGGGSVKFGTDSAGNHNHSMNGAGNHNHSMGGAGSHNHTIGNSGGSETRPRNVALMYIIRY